MCRRLKPVSFVASATSSHGGFWVSSTRNLRLDRVTFSHRRRSTPIRTPYARFLLMVHFVHRWGPFIMRFIQSPKTSAYPPDVDNGRVLHTEEDCLTLNVYSPIVAGGCPQDAASKLPVMSTVSRCDNSHPSSEHCSHASSWRWT